MWYEGNASDLLGSLPEDEYYVDFLSDGVNFFVWVKGDSSVDFIKSSENERGEFIVITNADNKTLAFVTQNSATLIGHIVPCISPSSVNPFAHYDPEIADTDFQMLCKDGSLRDVIKLEGILYLNSGNTELEPFKTSTQIVRMANKTQRYKYQKKWFGPHFHYFLN